MAKTQPTAPKKKKYTKWPVAANRITQNYQAGHSAIDIDTGTGQPVVSPTYGTIVRAATGSTDYGNHVVIEGPDKELIYLAHFDQPPNVKVGDKVKPGDQVGLSGSTGRSTGDHLHYEIRTAGGGGYINPLDMYDSVPDYPLPKSTSPGKKTSSIGVPPGTKITESRKEKISEKAATAPDWLDPLAESLLGPFWKEDIGAFDWSRFFVVLIGAVILVLGAYGWIQSEGVRVAAKVGKGIIANA